MDDDGGQHHRGKLEVSSPVAALFGIGFAFVLLAILHLIYVGCSGDSAVQLVVTVRYGKERKEDECVVCLSQFVQGEEVRVLVQCGHVFHVSCIETWLRSHPTCPICRVNTVAGGR
nr:RING-H2 finger protein ATL51-like [Ipomoea batatas]